MSQDQIETERKFSLTLEAFENLRGRRYLNPDRHHFGETKEIIREYIYFDTPESDLLNKGITCSVRLRPPESVLTIKMPCSGSSIESRLEYEVTFKESFPLELGAKPPAIPSSGLTEKTIDSDKLVGVLRMQVELCRIPIFNHAQQYVLELGLARYHGKNTKSMSDYIYEAEVELEGNGTLNDLDDFCRELLKIGEVKQIFLNKYQRLTKLLQKEK